MDKEVFKVFINLLMHTDAWPEYIHGEMQLKEWADTEARKLGFNSWIDAYHLLNWGG